MYARAVPTTEAWYSTILSDIPTLQQEAYYCYSCPRFSHISAWLLLHTLHWSGLPRVGYPHCRARHMRHSYRTGYVSAYMLDVLHWLPLQWPYSWVCRKAYFQHKYRVATPTFEVRVISVFLGLSYGSMLDVNLLMVDPTNKPATTNIAEKSQHGGHCESLHSTTF